MWHREVMMLDVDILNKAAVNVYKDVLDTL